MRAVIPRWGALLPLEFCADEPRMWRWANTHLSEAHASWSAAGLAWVDGSEVFVWAIRGADVAEGEPPQLEPWEPGMPLPPWGRSLALLVTATVP